MSEEVARWRGLTPATAVPAPRSASVAWWGMALLVATEAMLFAALISAYFFLRWQGEGPWSPQGIPDPALPRPAALTAVLAARALAVLAAERAARRGRRGALGGWLALTALAGLAALGLQAWDFAVKADEFTPQANAYASLVYTLPGAHAVHVAGGVVQVAWVLVRALGGAYTPERHTGVSVLAIYWYFLAALAVVLFATVQLTPYL